MKLFQSEISQLLSLDINSLNESQLRVAYEDIYQAISNLGDELVRLDGRFDRVKTFEELAGLIQGDMPIDSQELDIPTPEEVVLANNRSDILAVTRAKKEKYKEIQRVIASLMEKNLVIQERLSLLSPKMGHSG